MRAAPNKPPITANLLIDQTPPLALRVVRLAREAADRGDCALAICALDCVIGLASSHLGQKYEQKK
jgi:hypothetical protein